MRLHAIHRLARQSIRRCLLLAGIFGLLGCLLLARLAQLQLWSAPAAGLAAEAVRQRETELLLDTGRGGFVDRNGRPITGERRYVLAAFPVRREADRLLRDAAALSAATGFGREALREWLSRRNEPAAWPSTDNAEPLSPGQAAAVAALRIDGVYALPAAVRYRSGESGIHAIGYISQHPERMGRLYGRELKSGARRLTDPIGGSGLELSLDSLLQGAGRTAAKLYTDGRGKPLPGLELRLNRPGNPYYPLTVVTTIDLALQRRLERYAADSGLDRGAIVVLDARNGDILAMVSRPALNPLHPAAPGSDPANHALRAVAPGSVFKLITEAAALEYGRAAETETFHCDGEYAKYGLSCWLPGGHGTLTLREALARSCNVAFAAVAERLTPEQLALTADRLGIGRPVGWAVGGEAGGKRQRTRLLPEEEGGRVFLGTPPRRPEGGLMAGTGIGQRDTALSPLQAANLVVTLLNGGRVLAPRLAAEIRYADGSRMAAYPPHEAPSAYGHIRPSTARALLRGMEAVVAEGTGRAAERAVWRLAGKSGTAQAGRSVNHQWFVGYGPVASPRYAAAVLAERRPAGSANLATEVFRGVMDLLAANEKASAAPRPHK